MERFWAKTQRVPSGCLIWTAAKNSKGYGRFGYNGANRYAHNVAWILAHGAIPTGMIIMHACDVPSCVNPAHLSAGTVKDNNSDMIKKGRARLGGYPRKLTNEQVAEIRMSKEDALTTATRFGIARRYVYQIRKGHFRK